MQNEPSIAILLEFGFHDIKKYIHSGFAAKLSKKINIIWFAIDKGDAVFDAYFKETGFPLVYFKSSDFTLSVLKTENINNTIRTGWMLNNKISTFHNFKKVKQKSLKSSLLGIKVLKQIFEKQTLIKIQEYYKSTKFDLFFDIYNVKYLLGTGYGTSYSKCAFIAAQRKKIKTFFLIGSWKDLYLNNFIPFNFLEGIFVWSEQMKSDYLYHMPYLKAEKIHVTGNPSFDVLISGGPKFNNKYYRTKYRIPEKAELLLYTMMPPGLVNNEIETVILVANELLRKYTPEEITIILRRNPNHSTLDFLNQELPVNVALADHYCTYDDEKDMIVQSPEGECEWIDLLHHCSLNLSVPSTVTLEFKILNKPVLNIGFGPDGKPDERIRQHFEAGFYKPLFSTDGVYKVTDIQTFLSIFEKALTTRNSNGNSINTQAITPALASDLIIERIMEFS